MQYFYYLCSEFGIVDTYESKKPNYNTYFSFCGMGT